MGCGVEGKEKLMDRGVEGNENETKGQGSGVKSRMKGTRAQRDGEGAVELVKELINYLHKAIISGNIPGVYCPSVITYSRFRYLGDYTWVKIDTCDTATRGVVKIDTCDTGVLKIDGHKILGQNVQNKNRHGDTAPVLKFDTATQ